MTEAEIIELAKKYLDLSIIESGKDLHQIIKIDKRDPMYGGKGIVYLLHMFKQEDLANNRLASYMILPNKNDSSGFHQHGDRHEQELYVVMHGQGEFLDKVGENGEVRTTKISNGSITSVRYDGYHSIINTTDEPLILFVITTNEK